MAKTVKSSLDRIAKSLSKTHDDREFLLRNTRQIITLCSRAIISMHNADVKSAGASLGRAGKLLERYRRKAAGDLKRYMVVPEQEYVEAACLLCILENKPIPSDRGLKVMPDSYVLGLLDCIGELKRAILDRMRAGKIVDATRLFDIMEELYLYLYPFSMYDKVVKDARRKIDVCRILVEDIRGVITEEKSRSDLIRALEKSGK